MFRLIWVYRKCANEPHQSIRLSSSRLLSDENFSLWFDEYAIALIASYLSKRYQSAKIRSSFSLYLEAFGRASKGFIIEPILFNLFVNDLELCIQEKKACNFPNDKTINLCSPNFKEETLKLFNDTYFILNWFRINRIAKNPSKFEIMFPGSNNDNSKTTFIKNKRVKSRDETKLPDI